MKDGEMVMVGGSKMDKGVGDKIVPVLPTTPQRKTEVDVVRGVGLVQEDVIDPLGCIVDTAGEGGEGDDYTGCRRGRRRWKLDTTTTATTTTTTSSSSSSSSSVLVVGDHLDDLCNLIDSIGAMVEGTEGCSTTREAIACVVDEGGGREEEEGGEGRREGWRKRREEEGLLP